MGVFADIRGETWGTPDCSPMTRGRSDRTGCLGSWAAAAWGKCSWACRRGAGRSRSRSSGPNWPPILTSGPGSGVRSRRLEKLSGLFTALVVDADLDAPMPWLATAYVAGPSLTEAVRGHGPLPGPQPDGAGGRAGRGPGGHPRGGSGAPRSEALQRAAGRGRAPGSSISGSPRPPRRAWRRARR